MIGQFVAWYLVVQLCMIAALPLAFRYFVHLPDRGYASAKILGVLLTGLLLWLGVSYGLLRNDLGGAWLALLTVGVLSVVAARSTLREMWRKPRAWIDWRYALFVELLFLTGFVAWAVVRSHDPAANHTEQPMDLMFMNSIWNSATYPPADAWLAGYPISYYYFGYWLLVTLGRLSAQPPAIAYNLGQACWYGLLLTGSFGVVYNLLAQRQGADQPVRSVAAAMGGLLAALAVAVAGNLQILFEWLVAKGYSVGAMVTWFDVHDFAERASVTDKWYISWDWWWWRSSRVLEDLDLSGNHIEVIDEFPAFSYILGDNHPHVLAMPVVLLVITMAFNLFLAPHHQPAEARRWRTMMARWTPLGFPGLILTVAVSGALIFLNTWDFPPYWLLLALALFVRETGARLTTRTPTLWPAFTNAALFAATLIIGVVAIYLPYFLTAQSQAGGFAPNFFHPTRLPQFTLMFGTFMLGLGALLLPAWSEHPPSLARFGKSLLVVWGVPLLFLAAALALAANGGPGAEILRRMALPAGAESHVAMALQRWMQQPWTALLAGFALAITAALVWQRLATDEDEEGEEDGCETDKALLFTLLLAGIGLLLIMTPELVYLRDNFGTRMNTVFKFYYQGWLLLALATAYGVTRAVRSISVGAPLTLVAAAVATAATLLLLISTHYSVAAAYAKTLGYHVDDPTYVPTFDATAYLQRENPSEMAAVQWIQEHTAPDALVLEGKGASYRANFNRISTMTGRPTLLGWDGHESQWRGSAYGTMVALRPETLQAIYSSASTQEITALLQEWDIAYVYVGPSEREQYRIDARIEERLQITMDLVFEDGNVRIYRRRG